MREIKFRAWDKVYKEMFLVDAVHSNGKAWIEIDGKTQLKTYVDRGLGFDVELMQYTGLDDDNNIEIYFGDIVSVRFEDKSADYFYSGTAVITESISFGIGILYDYDRDNPEKIWAVDEGGCIDDLWNDPDLWSIEVIGNIYENSELIK